MSELNFMPAYRLAVMICQRQASVVKVLDAHLAQIAAHNPALNAIVMLDEERARSSVRRPLAPTWRASHWLSSRFFRNSCG